MAPSIRYDPIWRRIKQDGIASQLDGKFPSESSRLEALNNWGALSWLHGHATATKLQHHYGVGHTSQEFLRADPARERYATHFRVAAHALHWGHLALSYQGEEALLRAAHVEPRVRQELGEILERVIAFGSLACDDQGHDGHCADAIREAERPFDLYRWLAAWKVAQHWRRVWSAVTAADSSAAALDQQEAKRAITRTLVCTEDRGYRLLSLCNGLDYVLRDLLQSGTTHLIVDSGVLWDTDPLGRDPAPEWDLIAAARVYLRDRFYQTPEALLLHSLVARVVAQGLIAPPHHPGLVEDLLRSTAGDEAHIRDMPDYHKRRLTEVRESAARGLSTTWAHVGTFTDVSLPDRPRLDLEDLLTQRTGSGRHSYPFTAGISVVVEPGAFGRPYYYAGPGRRYATVHLHQRASGDDKQIEGAQIVRVLGYLADRLGPLDASAVGNALVGWLLGGVSVEGPGSPCLRMAGRLLHDSKNTLQMHLRQLRTRSSCASLNEHTWVANFIDAILSAEQPGEDLPADLLGKFVLHLPWSVARFQDARSILEDLRKSAIAVAQTKRGAERGHALEVAVATDQLLMEPRPAVRILALGVTQVSETGDSLHEWDIVRVDLLTDGHWTVTAVECAIRRSKAKDDESQKKLDLLSSALHNRFTDLAEVRTSLGHLSAAGELSYEDARRGFRS